MSGAERRITILRLTRRMDLQALARAVGLKTNTLRNVIGGSNKSHAAREKLTNFFQENELWPGVRVTRRRATFGPDMEIESPTAEAAEEFLASFPAGVAERRGKVIRFLKTFEIEIDHEREAIVRRARPLEETAQ